MVGVRTYGRMGNFLFQAATTIAYALKHNQDFSLPNRTTDPFWNPLYLQHLVNPNYEQGREDVLINENGHQYQEIEWRDEWADKQVVLNGYWQSEKYFKQYRNEILFLFNFPYEKKDGVVGVHVRRGDYVHLRDKHPEVTKEWYQDAMAQFFGYKFKFFSDDVKWCKENFGGDPDIEFSSNANEEQDLIEGSCCEHNIISSSTFGWWMGWLNRNPDKKVVIPNLWFTENYPLNTSTIVPDYWIKL